MTYTGQALTEQKPAPKEPQKAVTGTEHPCCEKDVRVPCVCRISWSCPVHGGWCVGSHD